MWSYPGAAKGTFSVALAVLLAACADDGSSLGSRDHALAVPGPWQIPEEVLGSGDMQYVAYEGAGMWLGEAGCAGGLLAGTRLVGDHLAQRFPQVAKVGGYACRPIRGGSTTMSVHGAGRALDLHIPTVAPDSDADNDLGDEVGHFLIEHAELFGVQLVIWDEWSWGASRAEGNKGRIYTGVNPHHDHLHIELSVEAAARTSDWFSAALADGSADAAVDGAALDAGDAGMSDAGALTAEGGQAVQPTPEKPRPLRPVIEPILDDDPLPEDAAAPAQELETSEESVRAERVRGEGCSVSVSGARRPGGALSLLLAVCAATLRRRRRGLSASSAAP